MKMNVGSGEGLRLKRPGGTPGRAAPPGIQAAGGSVCLQQGAAQRLEAVGEHGATADAPAHLDQQGPVVVAVAMAADPEVKMRMSTVPAYGIRPGSRPLCTFAAPSVDDDDVAPASIGGPELARPSKANWW
jgi:hypothetical protein